jgi:hypothetical protein
LANGVTGLREMHASDVNGRQRHYYQANVASGKMQGPELFRTLFAMNATLQRKITTVIDLRTRKVCLQFWA